MADGRHTHIAASVASFGAGFLAQGIGNQGREIIKARRGYSDCENIHHLLWCEAQSRRCLQPNRHNLIYRALFRDSLVSARSARGLWISAVLKVSLQHALLVPTTRYRPKLRMRSVNVISVHISFRRCAWCDGSRTVTKMHAP
jgi:hypothetical protein